MRDAAARHVRSYAETAASLKYAEAPRMLARFLVELVQARDAVVQETLAGFAAGMTTRWPYSPKTRIPRDALALLLTTVEGQRAGRPGAEPLLAQLWLDWWQLVMREHSLGPGYR